MKYLLLWASAIFYTFASFGQVCTGVVTLYEPIEVDNDKQHLHTSFFMHTKTFVCDPKESDSNVPKLKGIQVNEVLFFGKLDIGTPKAQEKIRVRYRLAEGVTLGGGGYLNWEVIDPPYALKLTTKEKKLLTTTKHYAGNLFEVDYPADFTSSMAMEHQGKWYYAPTDEATFLSPDESVAFFVYSPHWGGEPKSYQKVGKNEVLVSQETKTPHATKHQQTTFKYVTFKDKKGHYYRSYVYKVSCHINNDGSKDSCEATTFGIKYRDKKAYNRYKKTYIDFKKSLIKTMPE